MEKYSTMQNVKGSFGENGGFVCLPSVNRCWDESAKKYFDVIPACSDVAQVAMIADEDDLNRPARFCRGDYLLFNLDDDNLETGYGLYTFENGGHKSKSVCSTAEIERIKKYGTKEGWTVFKVGALVGVFASLVPGGRRSPSFKGA